MLRRVLKGLCEKCCCKYKEQLNEAHIEIHFLEKSKEWIFAYCYLKKERKKASSKLYVMENIVEKNGE